MSLLQRFKDVEDILSSSSANEVQEETVISLTGSDESPTESTGEDYDAPATEISNDKALEHTVRIIKTIFLPDM